MFRYVGLVVLASVLLAEITPAQAAERQVNPASLSQPAPASSSQIDWDATLNRHVRAEPASLNPVLTASYHEQQILELLFDQPVVFGPRLEWTLNKAMVESYQEAPDHLSAHLKLKDGLQWHDGKPLTAEDVVFSWSVITNEKTPAYASRAHAQAIESCKAVDDTTVELVFKEAVATNRWAIQFPVIPEHVYATLVKEDPSLSRCTECVKANRAPIGNGPYKLAEWEPGTRLVFERWDEYPGSKPLIKTQIFHVVPDANSALLLFKEGKLDAIEVQPAVFQALKEDPDFGRNAVLARADKGTIYCIGWNETNNPFFADKRVRQAMSYALNVKQLRESVYDGLFSRCGGLFPGIPWLFREDRKPFRFDLEKAGKLLDEAGIELNADDGWRYKMVTNSRGKVRSKRFTFTLNIAQESKTSPQVAAILQQDLRKIGVDMKIRKLEYGALRSLVIARKSQAFFWAWLTPAEPDEASDLFSTDAIAAGRNFVGYSNPQVDELFEEGRHEFQSGDRRAIYSKLSAILYEDAPYTFIVSAPSLYAFNRKLHGVTFSPLGPFLFEPGVRDWWFASEQGQPAVTGGPCEYDEYSGKAIITKIVEAPSDEYNCPNHPVAVHFRFEPANTSKDNPVQADCRLMLPGGKNPPRSWVNTSGIRVGKSLECICKRIRKGTCSPVVWEFPTLDMQKGIKDCYARSRQ